jgi:hypothetical protein
VDDKTLQALTALANKLGTTAEYLWGVLLRQAPITGAIDIALMAAWVAITWMWCRFVLRKTTEPEETDADRYPRADWSDEAAFFAWLSAIAIVCVTVLIVTSSLATAIAALVNPEYWALRHILR